MELELEALVITLFARPKLQINFMIKEYYQWHMLDRTPEVPNFSFVIVVKTLSILMGSILALVKLWRVWM
jgi:hypothetical protein